VITGGSGGIGRETALLFAAEGARVTVTGCSKLDAGARTVEEIGQTGGEALFLPLDVTDEEQVLRVREETLARYGRIDILVNNAGIVSDGFLTKLTRQAWDKVIDVNLTGMFNCTRTMVPAMIDNRFGRVINAASVVGIYGNLGQSNYVATKAAIIGLTKVWARELGPKGVTVNAVAPGFVATGMTAGLPEKVLNRVKERTPLGRLGEPREIAYAYLFLASDEASFVNGVILGVDGGLVV
jgi:3-oxoacyl-[acyl-carrier protein] reductase